MMSPPSNTKSGFEHPSWRPTRYRKLPVVIEAMRLNAYMCALPGEGRLHALYYWMVDGGAEFHLDQQDPGPAYLMIHTLEGYMRADIGDWVIKGVKGEFYPCKDDIFAMTYEEAPRMLTIDDYTGKATDAQS